MSMLKGLYDYHKRLCNTPGSNVLQQGLQRRNIHYVIEIDDNGNFKQLKSLAHTTEDGKPQAGLTFTCANEVKRGSNITPNFGFDVPPYLLGVNDGAKKLEEWKKLINSTPAKSKMLKAVQKFYENFDTNLKALEAIGKDYVDYIRSITSWTTFALEGTDEMLLSCPEMLELSLKRYATTKINGICTITQQPAEIARIHESFKIGGNKCTFIAVKDKKGYSGMGGEQGYTSPVSASAMAQVNAAIAYLLNKPEQHIRVGELKKPNIFTFCWTDAPTSFEENFRNICFPKHTADKLPNETESEGKPDIVDVLTGYVNGPEKDIGCHILCIEPNQTRVIERFYYTATVGQVATNLLRFYSDNEITQGKKNMGFLAPLRIYQIKNELNKVARGIVARHIEDVFTGRAYDLAMFHRLMTAIVERSITEKQFPRLSSNAVGLLKAYYIRNFKKDYKMSLDTTNTDKGYLCGRLFATYVKMYNEEAPKSSAMLKDFAIATTRPASAIASAQSLVMANLRKLSVPARIKYDKLIQELVNMLGEIPETLTVQEQGAFLVGFYQQNQAFFTKNTTEQEQ